MRNPPNPQSKPVNLAGFHPLAVFRVAVGALFILSGFLKLMQPYQNFLYVIQTYQALPAPLDTVMARVFPWLEYLAGIYVLLGLWTRPAMAILWALNTAFIGGLWSALLRGLPIHDCGCFGEMLSLPPQAMLALDVVIWGLFFVSWKSPRGVSAKSLDGLFEPRPTSSAAPASSKHKKQ